MDNDYFYSWLTDENNEPARSRQAGPRFAQTASPSLQSSGSGMQAVVDRMSYDD